MDNERELIDRNIVESEGIYKTLWIRWKARRPELWLTEEESKELELPPAPKPTFKPLSCKRCNRTWTMP